MPENQVTHLKNLISAKRAISQLVVKEKKEGALIKKVCAILVEKRGYLTAWAALSAENGKFHTFAEAGVGNEFKNLTEKLKKGELCGCCSKSFHQKKVVVTARPEKDCLDCPLSQKYTDRGSFSTPLIYENHVFGIFSASAPKKFVSEKEEQELFLEVADDLSFALHSLELEKKRSAAEEALRHEQFLLNTLMNNLPEHIYFKNRKSEFIRINKSMSKLFGLKKPEDAIGKTDFDFFTASHAQPAYEDEQKIIQSGNPVVGKEEKETWPDGTVTWVSSTKMPLKDKDGQITGTFGISTDITDRKETERRLMESENKFRKIGNSALDAVIMINSNDEVEFWNPAAEKMFGYTQEEIKDKKVHDLIMPRKYLKQQQIGWKEFLETGQGNAIGKVVELSALRANGEEFPIEIALSSMKMNESFWALASIRDITERKETEKALLERKQLVEKLTENIPGLVYQFRYYPSGHSSMPYASKSIETIFGVKPEEVKDDASKVFKVIHKDDLPEVIRSIKESFEKLTIWEANYRVVLPQKDARWLRGFSKPEKLPDGSVLWHGFIRDVTETKQWEEELKLQKEQFELAVNGSNDGIWDWNLKTNELFLSAKWKDQLGYKEDELSNEFSTFENLILPEDRSKVKNYVGSYLQGELADYDIEFRMRHKNGSIRWINARGEALRDKNGKPYRMAGSHTDITGRKEAEHKLQDAFSRVKVIMNSVQAGIILVRKKDRVVEDINPAVEKMLGIKKEDIVGYKCNKHICPNETGGCVVFDKGKSLDNAERSVKHISGKIIPVIKNAVITNIDGEEYLLESFVDISKQKEAEKELDIARLDAEAANKAKSEFLANMSHEIRTPMNSILGFSEVMLNTTHDEKNRGYLKTILNSGKTLLSLINDILDLSKIEAGRMEVSPEPMDMRVVLYEMEQIFTQKIQEKNLELITSVDEDFPLNITFDEVRLRQILLNIIGNAVKFTSAGFVKTEIKIVTKKDCFIDFEIAISDSGIGIAEEDQKRIFDSFSQQSGQESRNYEGTGLGLAISKKLCELMNGKIGLESKPGEGSKFTIAFSDVKYSDEFIEQQDIYSWDVNNIEFEPAKIMVVDDVPYNRDLVPSLLEGYNFTFYEAEDGKKALEAVGEYSPDLILMDIRMPGMNGYEATQIIKKDKTQKSIPVIALTASTMKTETEKINQLFDGYLRKPIQKKSLVNELIRHLPYKEESVENVASDSDNNKNAPVEIDAKTKKEYRDLYFDRIDELEGGMIIEELEDFTQKISEFAEKRKLPFLLEKAGELKENIADFDFDKIIKRLAELKKIGE
ncbi:PAS domain S-box-containing protein [Tangfeifania diversioriginum]|uniref:histidine kinase n=1 Tax=Tangfeifania diversioriginum TaxID=1168035 RepID=A0A1M6MS79_9BACT|nr:PAS domain S-box protein [Tangfeifania diversioriginum]SHJ86262.1 PAS domain S-box-containing protein [Tangfeifania diversioriginum]